MILSQVKNTATYYAIQALHEERKSPITSLCKAAGISRSAYYKWLDRKPGKNEQLNEKICVLIKEIYEELDGILGYRQMTMNLNNEHHLKINEKRVLRLMRILHLKSVCRRKRKSYVKCSPEVTAANILNREFKSTNFGEKWLTDVTEMKYGSDRKAYLSAILDLSDKSIVSFMVGHSNNNALVFETFNIAHKEYPEAKPLFHSDRGYQYTSKAFHEKLVKASMTQSMSRVGRCIDNGPMESFWGMLKTEMYYLKKFETSEELKTAVCNYIDYYNNKRYQKRLNRMAPLVYRAYLKTIA